MITGSLAAGSVNLTRTRAGVASICHAMAIRITA
jgi:hypothetical protein